MSRLSPPTASPLQQPRLVLGSIGVGILAASIGVLWNELGAIGIVVAIGWATASAWILLSVARRFFGSRATHLVAAGAITVILTVGFVYPALNVQTAGRGTDRDDDADVAVRAAFSGDYPFGARTYLGNPITHMPGSLLIASPFVAVGGSALQNIFLIPGIAWLMRRRGGMKAAAWAVAFMAATLGFWHEVATGGNSHVEWFLITAVAFWTLESTTSRSRILLAILLGVVLCARANDVTALPVVMAAVFRRSGARAATTVGIAASASFSLLTLPFYLAHPSGYTPLSSGALKFAEYSSKLPAGRWVLPILGMLAAVIAGAYVATRLPDPLVGLALGLAASQVVQFVVIAGISLAVGSRHSAVGWIGYVALGVVPAGIALGMAMTRSETPVRA